MPVPLLLLAVGLFAAWVGHAYLWTSLLNYVYARPYPKSLLKLWRLITGFLILIFWVPALALLLKGSLPGSGLTADALLVYGAVCLAVGLLLYPAINLYRLFRKPPPALVAETIHTLDMRKELGDEVIGAGKGVRLAKLPLNCIFQVDFTELTLAVPNLPAAWDGLTILLLSDIHFHGTPSRAFYERVLSEIETRWPTPDLVCLAGDYVDTDQHHTWIGPLLGRLTATSGKFAVLGNHDLNHHPDTIRAELAAAGYTVVGNGWVEATVRGERCVVVGHEGPWFAPPADLSKAPPDLFRLCISHTPDQFYWGQTHRVGLMLCGHVHGGQIRVPLIGSIFVPSVYGRRFDMGVFEKNGTVMVVGRGLSGKAPLRFRCHPQVLWLTLKPAR